MKNLTIREALAEGYKYCGYSKVEILIPLESMDEDSFLSLFKRYKKIYLAEKDCEVRGIMTAQDILGVIDESIDRSERGLESTSEIISSYELELQDLLDRMKEEIIDKDATHTYALTDISLIT
jgi:hypothetical protein